VRTEYDKDVRDATLKALLSGGLSGAAFGGGAGVLSGSSPIKGALVGGLGGAALAGGSTYLGSKLMGAPDDGDPTGYTKRAGLGGALAGGTIGGGLGALAGGTKLGASMVPEFAQKYASALRDMKGGTAWLHFAMLVSKASLLLSVLTTARPEARLTPQLCSQSNTSVGIHLVALSAFATRCR